jgi:hypothetical protein
MKSGPTNSFRRVLARRPGRPSTTPFHARPLKTTEEKFASTASTTKPECCNWKACFRASQSTRQATSPATIAMTASFAAGRPQRRRRLRGI